MRCPKLENPTRNVFCRRNLDLESRVSVDEALFSSTLPSHFRRNEVVAKDDNLKNQRGEQIDFILAFDYYRNILDSSINEAAIGTILSSALRRLSCFQGQWKMKECK